MPSYKTTLLGLFALLGAPVLAWDDCVAVSYDNFQETRTNEHLPPIIPKGMYSNDANGTCIYVDVSANGAFAKNHATEHSAFITAFQEHGMAVPGIEFVGPVTAGLPRRAVPCGSSCGKNTGKKKCNVGCNCILDSTFCDPFTCYNTISVGAPPSRCLSSCLQHGVYGSRGFRSFEYTVGAAR